MADNFNRMKTQNALNTQNTLRKKNTIRRQNDFRRTPHHDPQNHDDASAMVVADEGSNRSHTPEFYRT